MELRRLWLTHFRNYAAAEVELSSGLTVLLGDNGQGKTNLLEAIGFIATLGSFRGAPNEALVARGETAAVIRAEGVREGRELLVEAEISATGRNRVQVNRQRLARARDLLGALRVTVFAPDDLVLVKGGPAERRRYLDETLVAADPRKDVVRTDLDRIIRQRNALLRSAGGRLSDDVETTLAVWDAKLTETGEAVAEARDRLVERLEPILVETYRQVAHREVDVCMRYDAPWRADGLAAALARVRSDELRRGVTLVGPHRDELHIELEGLPARTHASQGEQRSLALALRLAAHRLVTTEAGTPPVLLLDDVFSELDQGRARALLANLPVGQAVVTSATGVPSGAEPELVLEVSAGRVRAPGTRV